MHDRAEHARFGLIRSQDVDVAKQIRTKRLGWRRIEDRLRAFPSCESQSGTNRVERCFELEQRVACTGGSYSRTLSMSDAGNTAFAPEATMIEF